MATKYKIYRPAPYDDVVVHANEMTVSSSGALLLYPTGSPPSMPLLVLAPGTWSTAGHLLEDAK